MSGFTRARLVGGIFGALAIGVGTVDPNGSGSGRAHSGPITALVSSNATLNGLGVDVLGAGDKVEDAPQEELNDHVAVQQLPRFHQPWVKPKSPNAERIEKTLCEGTELAFVDNPLEDGVRYLSDLHHIEIIIDKAALVAAGVNPEAEVTLQINGISLKSGLKLLLEPLALDYVIQDEVLKITTAAKLSKTIETRVYNVSRIKNISAADLAEIVAATIAPNSWVLQPKGAIATPVALQSRGLQLSGMPPGAMSPGMPPALAGDLQTAKAEGSIRSTGKSLVIRQSIRIHDEIVDLLNDIEDIDNEQPAEAPAKGVSDHK